MPDIADSPSADAASLLRRQLLASLRRPAALCLLYLNHDDDSAEDAVQEEPCWPPAARPDVSLAAAQLLRTWVFWRFKHKLIDEIRRQRRRAYLTPCPVRGRGLTILTHSLTRAATGTPTTSRPPGAIRTSLEQRQFWRVFEPA